MEQQKLRIEFDEFELEYQLFDNDFVRRWAKVVQKAVEDQRTISNGGNFYGGAILKESDLRERMRRWIAIVNEFKAGTIRHDVFPNMPRAHLMTLHEEFERLEPLEEFRSGPREVFQALSQLNIAIHQYEGLDSPPLDHIDLLFHPVDRYCFVSEDFQRFTTEINPGWLYLAYGVTGVPVINAFCTDHALEPVPQSDFTAGMQLCFQSHSEFKQKGELAHWLKTRWNRDIADPTLALGYIPLGRLLLEPGISLDNVIDRILNSPRKIKSVNLSPRPQIMGISSEIRSFFKEDANSRKVGARSVATHDPKAISGSLFSVHFSNHAGTSSFRLDFDLLEHRVARRWLELMSQAKAGNHRIIDQGRFFGFGLHSQEELHRQIKMLVAAIQLQDPSVFGPRSGFGQECSELAADAEWLMARISEIRETLSAFEPLEKMHCLLNLIHRAMEVSRPEHEGHVNIDLSPVLSLPLEKEDYLHFTPDEEWGALYLSYGQLGVSPLSAFFSKSFEDYQTQKCITTGMSLHFYDDRQFSRQGSVDEWLRERSDRGLQSEAFGFGRIPLGSLVLGGRTRQEIAEKLRKNPVVTGFSIPGSEQFAKVPAKWPNAGELHRHLEYTPWLFLPLEFDHRGCFDEATAFLDRFVVHRSSYQSSMEKKPGQWKSLGIHALNGDFTKTQNHVDYGVDTPNYSITEIARHCPKTMAFLAELTDLSQCQRVRFMLLEPGAKIHVHSDAPDREVSYAVNIALNMPERMRLLG